MSTVLSTDASVADAWVQFDIVTPQPEIWVTYEMRIPASTLSLMLSSGGAFFSCIFPTADPGFPGDPTTDAFGVTGGGWGPGGTGDPDPDVWMLCEHQHITASIGAFYVDTVQIASPTDFASIDSNLVRIGQTNTFGLDPSLVYFRNVKIGPTRGSDDYLSWPNTETNLDAWTTVQGDASVIPDPFVPPPVLIYTRIYGIQISLSDDGVEQVTSLVTSQDGF